MKKKIACSLIVIICISLAIILYQVNKRDNASDIEEIGATEKLSVVEETERPESTEELETIHNAEFGDSEELETDQVVKDISIEIYDKVSDSDKELIEDAIEVLDLDSVEEATQAPAKQETPEQPQVKPEPTPPPETKPESKAESTPPPETKSKPKAEPTPPSELKSESKAEPIPQAEVNPEQGSKPVPSGVPSGASLTVGDSVGHLFSYSTGLGENAKTTRVLVEFGKRIQVSGMDNSGQGFGGSYFPDGSIGFSFGEPDLTDAQISQIIDIAIKFQNAYE